MDLTQVIIEEEAQLEIGSELAEEQPRVMMCIPTGYPKDYSLFYMMASIENIDYENLEVHWFITNRGTEQDAWFLDKVRKMVELTKWNFPVFVHDSPLAARETNIPYMAIIRNRLMMRATFLDSDCEEMFIVGGDNPPWRSSIKRMHKIDADVVYGTSYQRPTRDRMNPDATYPMVWTFGWSKEHLNRFGKIDPILLQEFKWAYINATYLVPIWNHPKYKRRGELDEAVVFGVTAGDGNCLIKREVLELLGWSLPLGGYHSEDINFGNWCNWYGFKTAVDLKYHVPHYHKNGGFF